MKQKSEKKIIIINHYGITPDMPGATRHYDMAKKFASKGGYEIEFWMCGYNHHTGKYASELKGKLFQASEKRDGFRVTKIRSTPYRKSAVLRQVNITVFDIITATKLLIRGDTSAVVLSMPPVSIFNVLALVWKKIKFIADVEDLWPLFLVEMGMKNAPAAWYMNFASNYAYQKASAVEAVSNGMLDYIKGRVNAGKKLFWMSPLGVELPDSRPPEPDLIKNKKWRDGLKVFYIGAHGRANALDAVLHTIRDFNGLNRSSEKRIRVSFVFIGDGDRKKDLGRMKEKLKLDNVYFEEAIPSRQVMEYLKLGDVCLTNLKRIESFQLVRPNKIFQYMAAARPVICGIWGEAGEIVETSGAGICVNFEDPMNAAKKILDFISDPQALEACGKRGYQYVERYGNREKILDMYYEKVLEVIGTAQT